MYVTDDLDILAGLAALEPVGLDALATIDDLQIRTDRKYLVPLTYLRDLASAFPPGTRTLTIDGTRSFRYQSVYFDTADLVSYLGAARRRPSRFKVRTRSYLDTSGCMLEVKTRDLRGRTVKHRQPHDLAHRAELTPGGRQFVASVAQSATAVDHLRPILTTAYRRATLMVADGNARATLDIDLMWCRPDGRATRLTDLALVETKTRGKPCSVDRALWRAGHRPITISKYCTGLAALHPDLPANKWNRVLRRHFGWLPTKLP
jgi:hypothetical protein